MEKQWKVSLKDSAQVDTKRDCTKRQEEELEYVGSSETDKLTTSEKAEVTDDIQQHTTSSDFLESTPLISHKLFSSTTILWPPNLEELLLTRINSIEVLFDLEGLKVDNDRQGITILSELKYLRVDDSSKLAYMWKNVPRGIQGFQNLTSIEVSFCDHLIYLIPLSVAKLLVKLQSIKLSRCGAIKNIVQRDGEEEAADIITFPKLSSLMLSGLPNLGTLTKLKDPRASDINNSSKIWSLFPSNLIECLKNLESVNLRWCDSIEVIFQLEELNVEESHVAPVLDQLRELHLDHLPKLMHIWKKGPKMIMGFGNLKLLKVENCNNLTNLFSPSIGKLLVMTFVPTNLKKPELERVYEDKGFKTPQWKGDLNATIEHIFKGKEKQVDHETQQQEKLRPMRQNSETDM
ncbi:hypothetical protein SO802_021075 [Lithocarpus litseifolius]|uniref:Disease resistance protein At4g27190-like leucine-rich repeats domain-containing protein n=1 Tax=Lithocarpus litseifolius TaxID=425828 RepID=A0AAW2CGN0_9ROSI